MCMALVSEFKFLWCEEASASCQVPSGGAAAIKLPEFEKSWQPHFPDLG